MFNPLPNEPWILCVYSISHLNTLWEKEKLLITSNFFFSIGLENFMPFITTLNLSTANSLSLEESKCCCLGKG